MSEPKSLGEKIEAREALQKKKARTAKERALALLTPAQETLRALLNGSAPLTLRGIDAPPEAKIPPGAKWVSPDGCAAAAAASAEGWPKKKIAALLGMRASTLNHCIGRQPELAEALGRGEAELAFELTNRLLEISRLGGRDGLTATIFLTKALPSMGWRDHGPQTEVNVRVNTQGGPAGVVVLPKIPDTAEGHRYWADFYGPGGRGTMERPRIIEPGSPEALTLEKQVKEE